jgi:hypothetical protein
VLRASAFPNNTAHNKGFVFQAGTSDQAEASWVPYFSILASNGYVGIGTTAPTQLLHVKGSANAAYIVADTTTSGYSGFACQSQGVTRGSFEIDASALSVDIYNETFSGSNPVIRCSSSGFVGIGTKSPLSLLHVQGVASAGVLVAETLVNNAGAAVGQSVRIRLAPFSGFVASPSVTPYIESIVEDAGVGSSGLALGTFNGASLVERMRVTGTGNFGIGITAPTSTLHVYGPVITTNSLTWHAGSLLSIEAGGQVEIAHGWLGAAPWTAWMQCRSNAGVAVGLAINPSGGNVGINQINPAYALDVTGDVNVTGAFRVNGTAISSGGGVTTQKRAGTDITRALGTWYQNGSKPTFVTVAVSVVGGTTFMTGGCQVFCGPTNGNNISVGQALVPNTSQGANGSPFAVISFWVLPSYWYEVAVSSSGTGTAPTIALQTWTEWN